MRCALVESADDIVDGLEVGFGWLAHVGFLHGELASASAICDVVRHEKGISTVVYYASESVSAPWLRASAFP